MGLIVTIECCLQQEENAAVDKEYDEARATIQRLGAIRQARGGASACTQLATLPLLHLENDGA